MHTEFCKQYTFVTRTRITARGLMRYATSLLLAFLGTVLVPASAWSQSDRIAGKVQLPAPLVDYHLHIQSEALSQTLRRCANQNPKPFEGMNWEVFSPRSGSDALRVMNAAGMKYGVLLSEAYMFTSPLLGIQNLDKARLTREENAFNVAAAAHSGGRLTAFISVNPLSPTAAGEIAFWHSAGGASGIKLHLANSGFNFQSRRDIAALRQVFSDANKDRLPIIVHLRNRQNYGAAQVDTFINQVLPAATGLPVQIAHGAGWGGLDEQTISAITAFATAIAAHRPGTSGLTFDLALVVLDDHTPPELARRFVVQMRRIGIQRFDMGSDWPAVYTPAQYVKLVEQQLPLTPQEWRIILSHRASYIGKSTAE